MIHEYMYTTTDHAVVNAALRLLKSRKPGLIDGFYGYVLKVAHDTVYESEYPRLPTSWTISMKEACRDNSYLTAADCADYQVRRQPDHVHTTHDFGLMELAKRLIFAGEPGWIGEVYGYVLKIDYHAGKPLGTPHDYFEMPESWSIFIRPTLCPLAAPQTAILRRGEITFPLNFMEDNVKIYEAIVVKLDPQTQEPTAVVKVVPPFVAKSSRAAEDQVLIDYAQENHMAGKDLTGLQVRVRMFLGEK